MKRLFGCLMVLLITTTPAYADVEAEELERAREALRQAQEEAREAARTLADLSRLEAQERRQEAQERARAMTERQREMSERQRELRDRSFGYSYSFGNRAVIGIVMSEDTDSNGVRLAGVTPGSAAAEAGLKTGDQIVAVNGERVDDQKYAKVALAEANALIGELEEGDVVTLTYLRNGDEMEAELEARTMNRSDFAVIAPRAPFGDGDIEFHEGDWQFYSEEWEAFGEQWQDFAEQYAELAADAAQNWSFQVMPSAPVPPSAPVAPVAPVLAIPDFMVLGRGWQGLELSELNPDLGRYFGTDSGVLVVAADGLDTIDLRGGDVIIDVEDEPVETPRDVMRQLRSVDPGDEFTMRIMRDRDRITIDAIAPGLRAD
ncbi:MAG: hypothetical protein DHS20C11_20510 [Lysobacteraceae bacterium]|nr:MAG: hypothetical protein DHS20C11_20510 [Xanthomonadaceae bacterium]